MSNYPNKIYVRVYEEGTEDEWNSISDKLSDLVADGETAQVAVYELARTGTAVATFEVK